MEEIYFLHEKCKHREHKSCYGSWLGLGFKFICDCPCHKERIETSKGFEQLSLLLRLKGVPND